MNDCHSMAGQFFESISQTDKLSSPCRVCARDMRHILLVLPFLQHDLLGEEIQEYNDANPFDPTSDPSNECIGMVCLFLTWYNFSRRRFPPKDEFDIEDQSVFG